ncbi:7513_t:CDS:2 [Cetraspora pellucida]|uniref:7513_t:CDS:1 n=1 Tax=Cetraspora pellucida TaxID=1433469 RepID=A0A9N9C9C7_9GLOM|nr:7513_t:CDS:2 [Cetraspora pellucida]
MFLSLGINKSKKSDNMSPPKRKKTKLPTNKGKTKTKRISASDNSSVMTAASEATNDTSPPSNVGTNGNELTVDEKITDEPLDKKIHHGHTDVDQEKDHVNKQLGSSNGPQHSNESGINANANTAIYLSPRRDANTGPPSESESSITEDSGENALSDITAPTEEDKGIFSSREEGWGEDTKDNIQDYYTKLHNSNHFDRRNELQKILHANNVNTSAIANNQYPLTSPELDDNTANKNFNDQRYILFENSKNSQDIDESESSLTAKRLKPSNTSLSFVTTASRGLPLELFTDSLYIGPIDQLSPMGLTFYWLGWYTEAVFSQIADKLNIVDRFTGIPLSKLFLWIYSPKSWMGIKNEDLERLEAAKMRNSE